MTVRPRRRPQAWLAGLNRAILDSGLDCIVAIGNIRDDSETVQDAA